MLGCCKPLGVFGALGSLSPPQGVGSQDPKNAKVGKTGIK